MFVVQMGSKHKAGENTLVSFSDSCKTPAGDGGVV